MLGKNGVVHSCSGLFTIRRNPNETIELREQVSGLSNVLDDSSSFESAALLQCNSSSAEELEVTSWRGNAPTNVGISPIHRRGTIVNNL